MKRGTEKEQKEMENTNNNC